MDQIDSMLRRETAEAPVRAAANPRALIAVAALFATVTNAIAFMLPPLLPVITTSYAHNSVSAATWVFSALTLGGGAGFVLIPRLTDILSERAVTLLSGAFLTGGALVAAVLDSYPALIVGSVLLGFGGAAVMVPVSFLRRHLAGSGVSTAVMVLIMATGSGVVLGMVGGGVSVRLWPLPDHLNPDGSLPSLSIAPFFYLLAVLFVLTTVAMLVVVPSAPPTSSGRIGVLGTVWLIGWVTLVLLAFSAPADTAIGRNATTMLGIGIVAAIGWVFAERRSSRPVFDLSVLRKPYVTTACLASLLFGCVDAAFLVLVNYYAQNPTGLPASTNGGATGWPAHVAQYGLGYDPLQTSLLMLPFALTMFISGRFSERLIARGRPGLILVGGAAICAVGLLFLAVAHDQAWEYLVGSGIVGLGSRAGYSASFAIPQFVVPEEQAGMASAMPGTLMAIGFAVGAAVVTVVQNGSGFVYHSVDVASMLAGKLDPAAVNLKMSDYLLEGAHFPSAGTYTTGYLVAVGFPALVLLASLISRLRHPSGFPKVSEEHAQVHPPV